MNIEQIIEKDIMELKIAIRAVAKPGTPLIAKLCRSVDFKNFCVRGGRNGITGITLTVFDTMFKWDIFDDAGEYEFRRR
jgi:hypothetical protein